MRFAGFSSSDAINSVLESIDQLADQICRLFPQPILGGGYKYGRLFSSLSFSPFSSFPEKKISQFLQERNQLSRQKSENIIFSRELFENYLSILL